MNINRFFFNQPYPLIVQSGNARFGVVQQTFIEKLKTNPSLRKQLLLKAKTHETLNQTFPAELETVSASIQFRHARPSVKEHLSVHFLGGEDGCTPTHVIYIFQDGVNAKNNSWPKKERLNQVFNEIHRLLMNPN